MAKKVYKRICLSGDVYYEHPHILREFIFKLKNKYGYKLRIFTRGYNYGAEKWIKKYTLEFEIKYGEYNPAYTGRNMYSMMPGSYFYNKTTYNFTHILHVNYLLSKNTDMLIFFKSDTDTNKSDKTLIDAFKKQDKEILIIY